MGRRLRTSERATVPEHATGVNLAAPGAAAVRPLTDPLTPRTGSD